MIAPLQFVWIASSSCLEHGETSCDCESRSSIWRLAGDGAGLGVTIQQFGGGPFYGTWEAGGGGRTGPVTDLDDCKRRLEAMVPSMARPQ